MRVALVCGYDWAVPGGVQQQVGSIAGALARRGHEVTVVTPSGRPPAGAGEAYEVVGIGGTVGVRANGSVAPVAPSPGAMARAIQALRRADPDVVHVHEPLVPGPPLAAALAGPRPIVATFHRAGADALYLAEGVALGPLVARRTAVATAVSTAAAATARRVLGRRLGELVEIGNGVDLTRYGEARARRLAAGAAAGPYKDGSRPRVVFVGRHEPRKGAAVFVEAVRQLSLDLDAVVAGEGPETPALRRLAAGDERLRFVGAPDDAALAELVASCDVAVAPSLGGESFGMVLLEAMAAGTAVVASDIPGYRAAAAGAAVHVDPGDAAALAGALASVLADHRLRADLVERGRLRAEQLSIEVVADRYLECYEAARRVSRRGGPGGRGAAAVPQAPGTGQAGT
ncbi:MAG TPA: glycosyltransferase family 4 protein [Acidimicrobiales bacterium]|nr:glycosyltransferase family 4 protein [Acidimicrobiales bacterium]